MDFFHGHSQLSEALHLTSSSSSATAPLQASPLLLPPYRRLLCCCPLTGFSSATAPLHGSEWLRTQGVAEVRCTRICTCPSAVEAVCNLLVRRCTCGSTPRARPTSSMENARPHHSAPRAPRRWRRCRGRYVSYYLYNLTTFLPSYLPTLLPYCLTTLLPYYLTPLLGRLLLLVQPVRGLPRRGA